jgi:hypothetical protein
MNTAQPPRDSKHTIGVFLLILIALVVGALLGAFGARSARAHEHSRPDLDGWFLGLASHAKAPCCDGSDALRIDDVDWETKDGHYRVRLEGEWVDVPDSAVVDGPNRAGPTMVWPYRRDGHLNQIRCFMPGSMT